MPSGGQSLSQASIKHTDLERQTGEIEKTEHSQAHPSVGEEAEATWQDSYKERNSFRERKTHFNR